MRKNIPLIGSLFILLFFFSCSKDMAKIESELKAVYNDGTKMAQDITAKVTSSKSGPEVISIMNEMSEKFKALKIREDEIIRKNRITQPEMDKMMDNLKADLNEFSKSIEGSGLAIGKAVGQFLGDPKIIEAFNKWKKTLSGK